MACNRNNSERWLLLGALITMAVMSSPATAESSPCDVAKQSTFKDWKQWTKLTPEPVRSNGHSRNWVDIHVDELARDTYLSGDAPYAECAMIAKPEFRDKSANSVRKLTLMVKMPAGYDPDHANWWYGVADPDGEIKRSGKMYGCISCHRQVKATDYTFSRRLQK